MRAFLRWTLLTVLPALLLVRPAGAMTPEVKDEAGFFSPSAVQKADEQIREIKDRYHKDLLIETVKTVPADEVEKVKQMDRPERDRFFEEWGHSRARQAQVNGIYILICKDPAHLQIEVGNETQKKAFTLEDRDKLRDLLVERFKAKEYDQGLLDGVQFVRDRLQHNLTPGTGRAEQEPGAPGGDTTLPGRPNPGVGSWLPWVLVIGGIAVVGVLLLLAVLSWVGRSVAGYGGRYGPPAPGYGPPAPGYGYGPGYGGGGGFFSSLFGSLFGSAAGNWMYDRFFRGGPGYAGGWQNQTPPPASPDVSPSAPDTDYSGTGGDFDSGSQPAEAPLDPGGGDFGGSSDSGGGGDFGGGGGDTGGGGGF